VFYNFIKIYVEIFFYKKYTIILLIFEDFEFFTF
jgi:hypothetical protein